MKFHSVGKAFGATVSVAALTAIAVAGCGSNENTSGSTAASDCTGKEALKASGSSAQKNAMTRFITAYQAACPGFTVNYTSSGSGAGVSEFVGGITDFGGSDSPLNADKGEVDKAKERCGGNAAWNLPTVFGPIAVTYNLDGVDGLALDGPTLAKIFNGGVTKWNAAEVAGLNPGKTLPDEPITVLFRSDESGTTDNFQKYLDAASNGAWGKGAGKSFAGGVGEGAQGNEGTSAAIKNTPGSITYNEWSYAKSQGLQTASIVTPAAPDPVALTSESAGKSIDAVKVKGEGNDLVLDMTSIYVPAEAGAYPIVLPTYEIVCSKYPQSDVPPALKKFLTVAINEGQKGLEDNGYIPLPDRFKDRLNTAINAIS
ncbi:phosphate ABC transporter substrate-binding protein PstS [Mycobacterium sp. CVI_P3]|uniref:Phosphate-binding protein n=1 Tax=Mycobacterium pinniadriaticum TaxID=2994102 RepID=A0ABT3S7K0_9MYCO|nr:phosphate ABC transporter substrate-binding protein PstS [Mycobacterium pinniadriaticum]MCX2928796.1 phosphate ABC transporter substrate-binding protein PstS [Mycobacterium pinniadriaticum]MCX2935337.1 phosphate ABC transporter substrate-binding protein PstS [Mycobacterium pinniadriaticum]